MLASRELLSLIGGLTRADRDGFTEAYRCWKEKWDVFVNRRSVSKRTGRSHYTHRRLKTPVNSIDFYLPYLFTFRECAGIPNTNNKIEGVFTDLKKNLNNHSGMSEENRKRFIIGFFKAWLLPSRARLRFRPCGKVTCLNNTCGIRMKIFTLQNDLLKHTCQKKLQNDLHAKIPQFNGKITERKRLLIRLSAL